MVTVRLYASLRMLAGDKIVEVALPPAGTARDLLRRLEEVRPGLVGRLLDEEGQVPRFIAVFVNGREIRFLDGPGTSLNAADEVDVFPAVAGGGA
jgi:molybdopterin synthase sulfur carrier subunit